MGRRGKGREGGEEGGDREEERAIRGGETMQNRGERKRGKGKRERERDGKGGGTRRKKQGKTCWLCQCSARAAQDI